MPCFQASARLFPWALKTPILPRGTRGSGARVVSVVDLAEPLLTDMRIDLSRRDVGMAEHGLEGAQIRPSLQEVACEGMTKNVGGEGLLDAGRAGMAADNGPEAHPRQLASAEAQEELKLRFAPSQAGTHFAEVPGHRGLRDPAQGHQALLPALAEGGHDAEVEV